MRATGNSSISRTYKCALVPDGYFEPSKARATLAETVDVDDLDEVSHVDVPFFDAVLVYAHPAGDDALPELYRLLEDVRDMDGHNRIAASYCGGRLFLVVARDGRLLLCNSFSAVDFTTAEYFIFLIMSRFQLNPEVSAIRFRTPLSPEQETSLRRYFRRVDRV